MQFPRLKMESQKAMIAIRQTPAQLQLSQPKADINLRQPKADMQIRTTKGKLHINQSKAFAEANLKSALRWTEDEAAKGKQAILQGIAKRVRQGSQLIDIHNGGNAIAEQAKESGHPPYKTLGLKYIPSPFSVKINYDPASVDIQAKAHKPEMNVNTRKPHIGAERGGVSISMAREAYLRMYVEE